MGRWLIAAALTVAGPTLAPPPGITPIDQLTENPSAQHVEVLRVRRDFGHPSVDVVVDAWMPPEDADRIDDLRIWWTDELDRYPLSARTREYVGLTYERQGPDRWRVRVSALQGRSFELAFDVRLHEGRPAVFADIVLPGGRKVRDCRATEALLKGRQLFGNVIGMRSLVITCSDQAGKVHRAKVLRG